MTLRQIGPVPRPPCLSAQHSPPSHMVFRPGIYEWTCPACGKKTVFTVSGVY